MPSKEDYFDKLSSSKKRIYIAKDALAQLAADKFIAKTSVYLNANLGKKYTYNSKLVTVINNKKCEVCALGALFRSAVRVKNGLVVSDVAFQANPVTFFQVQASHIKDRLKLYFSASQIIEIEAAFEGCVVNSNVLPLTYIKRRKIEKQANMWINKYKLVEDRMKAILKNIIKNKGEFKISKL